MMIPTVPIGSIPRPKALLAAIAACGDGTDPSLDPLYDAAIRDTIQQFEATGSPVITDGEQRKYHNFWTIASKAYRTLHQTGLRFRSRRATYAGCLSPDGGSFSL